MTTRALPLLCKNDLILLDVYVTNALISLHVFALLHSFLHSLHHCLVGGKGGGGGCPIPVDLGAPPPPNGGGMGIGGMGGMGARGCIAM